MRRICYFLFFLSFICLAGDFFEEKEIENGFSTRDGDPQTIRISVLEVSQANRLYDEVSRDRKIPHRYPVDGCYARATAMTLIAEKQGIQMGKVFARGHLQAKTSSRRYPVVQWAKHMAPVIFVKQRDGEIRLMVCDPSLFNSLVTLEVWKNAILHKTKDYTPAIEELRFGTRFQYSSMLEPHKGSWVEGDLNDTKRTLVQYKKLEDPSVWASPRGKRSNSKSRGAVK